MRKHFLVILAFSSLSLLLAGCTGARLAAETSTEEQNIGFFGVGEPLAERSIMENLSIVQAFEKIEWLNVSCLREWVWRRMVFSGDGGGLNPENTNVLNDVLARAQSLNVSVMGMVQDFPEWMTQISGDSQAVPYRNLTEGSPYQEFLTQYEESWKTLSQAFPIIISWEIGNEYNLDDFLHPEGYDYNTSTPHFSLGEKTDIITDLLYYGSKGIHTGNPAALTVMGGLARNTSKNGLAYIKDSLEAVYGNVESGEWPSTNSSDFFEVACWHPYLFTLEPNQTNWIEPNNSIRNLMVAHGDVNKPVVFSELGYSDKIISEEAIAEYLTHSFALAREDFPWLKILYWFRLVEINESNNNNPKGFGLFNLDWTAKPAACSYELVVPEFPSHFLPLLFLGTMLVVAVNCQKRKRCPDPIKEG